MDKLVVKEIENASSRENKIIDDFIMDADTNGEFINSLNYLAYHPPGRFIDKSIFAMNEGSGVVCGVVMAAEDPTDSTCIISHPGTTFAGIIVNRRQSVKNIEEIFNNMMEYYEKRYISVVMKLRPDFFSLQPFGEIPYFLLKRGYKMCMSGLANVIDISGINSENDLFVLYNSKKRNQVRKVLKEKKFVFQGKSEICRDVWINMNHTLKEKHNANTTHTFEEMKELLNREPAYISAYRVDHVNGEYGAFALIYRFKYVFHTQYLDTNYKYTGQYPNLLLIHNLFQIAKKEGYAKFSFGVSTENNGQDLNYGLFSYKAGYGGGSMLQTDYRWTRKYIGE